MTLGDLREKLYQKVPEVSERPEEALTPLFTPRPDVGWQGKNRPSFFRQNIWLFIIVGVIIVGGFILLIVGTGGFSEGNVKLAILGPREVSGAQIVEWRVGVGNSNRVNLQEAELTFEYPPHAYAIDDPSLQGRISRLTIGTIEAGRDVERVFRARIFGGQDELQSVKARLTFKAPGISQAFTKEETGETKIISPPVTLFIEGPGEMESGGEGAWAVTFRNISDFDFQNLRLRLEYPENFSLISAQPPAHFSNDTWEIASLKVGQEKKIELRARLTGAIDEERIVKTFLEFPVKENEYVTLTKKIATTKIVLSPLSLTLTVNGKESVTAYPGETLSLELTYKNNTNEEINEAFVEVEFIGEVLDITSLQTDGVFDTSVKKIRWDITNAPALQVLSPGQEGKFNVSFAIQKKLPIKVFTDKNFQLRVLATIDATRPSLFLRSKGVREQRELSVRIGTKVELQVSGDDADGTFRNEGPIPPRVGKQTTYTVFWRITNTANEVRDFEVSVPLPSWSSFTGLKQANFAKDGLFYDKDKRQVIWTIDNLPATTGYALPVYEAAFQIALSPSESEVGKILDIIGQTEVKGVDAFTDQVIKFLTPPITTDLGGRLSQNQARVVQ